MGGTIVYRHPDLERGALLEAGTVVLRIDHADYRLEVERLEAQIAGTRAALDELEQSAANTRALLTLERESLAVVAADLERRRRLSESGSISEAAVDDAESAVLAQRQRVQQQENALALVPAERAALEATLARQEAELAGARLALERTEIRLPFAARIAEVAVEQGDYAAPGARLVVADGIDATDVAAQMPLDALSVPARQAVTRSEAGLPELDRSALKAVVRLEAGALTATWPACVVRIAEGVDPQTRTLDVLVRVDRPFQLAAPGFRPPLTKVMFVTVEVTGPPLPEAPLLPREALHDGTRVYVAGHDDRLEVRSVELGLRQDGFLTVADGLAPGERVLLTDLVPAVPGTLLSPRRDRAAERRMLEAAAGPVLSSPDAPEAATIP